MCIDFEISELEVLKTLTLSKAWIIENNRLNIYDNQLPTLNSILDKVNNAINEKAKDKETHK